MGSPQKVGSEYGIYGLRVTWGRFTHGAMWMVDVRVWDARTHLLEGVEIDTA